MAVLNQLFNEGRKTHRPRLMDHLNGPVNEDQRFPNRTLLLARYCRFALVAAGDLPVPAAACREPNYIVEI